MTRGSYGSSAFNNPSYSLSSSSYHCISRYPIDPVEGSDGDAALKTEVTAARSDGERERPVRLDPTLRVRVPDRKVVTRERDGHRVALLRVQEHVREATENAGRLARAGGEVDVELWDLWGAVLERHAREGGRLTSPPVTPPVFFTVNDTSNAGRCNHRAVELPSPTGVASPAAQADSSEANVLSESWSVLTLRFE